MTLFEFADSAFSTLHWIKRSELSFLSQLRQTVLKSEGRHDRDRKRLKSSVKLKKMRESKLNDQDKLTKWLLRAARKIEWAEKIWSQGRKWVTETVMLRILFHLKPQICCGSHSWMAILSSRRVLYTESLKPRERVLICRSRPLRPRLKR